MPKVTNRPTLQPKLTNSTTPAGPLADPKTPPAQPQVTSGTYTPKPKRQGEWRVNFTAGNHPIERFSPNKVRIKSSLMDVTIDHVQWNQRTSAEFFNVPERIRKGREAGLKYPVLEEGFRWIDEPNNEFCLELEKKGKFAVGFSAHHPKFLMALQEEQGGNENKNVHMVGVYNGEAIDKQVNLADYIAALQLTHKQMNFSVYGKKIFTVADGKAGSLLCTVGGRLALYTGQVHVSARVPGKQWDFYNNPESSKGMKVVGGGVTAEAALQYMLPGGRVGVGVKGEVNAGKLSYQFLDGTASHNQLSGSAAVFLAVNLWRSKE